MFSEIKKKLRSKLWGNFFSLSSIQFLNLVLPFLTIPFLTQKLGIEKFGLVNYIMAVSLYLSSILDFGFTYSATKEVSLNRGNNAKLNDIFNAVHTIKLSIGAIIILGLLSTVYFTNFLSKDYILLGFLILIICGQGFQSLYFFQGLERMKYISYINLLTKLTYTVLILVFIRQPSDYNLVILFYGITSVVALCTGYLILIKYFSISFYWTSYNLYFEQLKSGWSIFLSNVSTNVLINSNIIILAIFAPLAIVGNFSVAEKILVLSRALLIVILQATYPHICLLATERKEEALIFVKNIFIAILIIFLISLPVIYYGADLITYVLTGKVNLEISAIIKSMCFVPLIIALNVPASQMLLAFNYKKEYAYVMILAAVLNILLNFILVKKFQLLGTINTIIITELFITLSLYLLIFIKYPHINFLKIDRNNTK